MAAKYCPRWLFNVCASMTAYEFIISDMPIKSYSKKYSNGLNEHYGEIKSEEIYLQGNALRSCELIDYPGFDICNLPIEGNHLKDIYAIDLIIFIIWVDINRNELK